MDISSRGGKIPPVYLYLVFILPGFVFSFLKLGSLNYEPFIAISIAILPLLAAVNLFDDYFDYTRGIDKSDSPNTKYRRHPIFFYRIERGYLIKWAVIMSLVYFLLISLISFFYGFMLLPIAAGGFIIGYGYTGWPIGYKYLGLGEIGVFFSTLVAGLLVSAAVTGLILPSVIPFLFPFALLMILILYVGNYRDMAYDRESGFATLASFLGRKGSDIFVASVFAVFYLSVSVYSLVGIYPRLAVISLITAPLAFYLAAKWTHANRERYEQYIGPYVFSILIVLIIFILL